MFMDICTWSHGLLIQQSPSAFQNLTVRGQMVYCNPTLRFLVTAEQFLAPISKRHKFKFVEVFYGGVVMVSSNFLLLNLEMISTVDRNQP